MDLFVLKMVVDKSRGTICYNIVGYYKQINGFLNINLQICMQ